MLQRKQLCARSNPHQRPSLACLLSQCVLACCLAPHEQADFTQVIEMRPISGPSGVKNALVLIDAGNAGDFDYVWLKNAKTGKVLGVASKAAPPPMIVRVAVERGQIVRGVAYSKEAGLWEGDPFEVRVGEYRPQGMYEGRPDGPIGVFGEPLYR